MSRVCEITGKRRNKSNKVSFSNKHNRFFQQPNLQDKRFWLPDEKRWVRLRVSTRMIRTITKMGVRAAISKFGADVNALLYS